MPSHIKFNPCSFFLIILFAYSKAVMLLKGITHSLCDFKYLHCHLVASFDQVIDDKNKS